MTTQRHPDDPSTLLIASWNIHRGRLNIGGVDPARVADVLIDEVHSPCLDILVLQEADEEQRPHRGVLDLDGISARTDLIHGHQGKRTTWGPESHGFLGTILFLGAEMGLQDLHLLDLPGYCHRGAVIAEVKNRRDGTRLLVVGTHLSLGQPLRIAQMRAIGQHLQRRPKVPVVVAGDLNEWRPWGGLALSPRITGIRLDGPARRSFPCARPILPLDRILAGQGARVEDFAVLDGPGVRATSDHRPVRASVRLDAR